MRISSRGPRAARLVVEALEDRLTPAVAYALSGANLISFSTAAPATITATTAITGVAGSEALVGIDFRPANGLLYGLGVNATADTATLYTINTATAVATAVGTPGQITFTTNGTTLVDLPDPTTVGYGFDFNPTVDRIRVVAGTLNFRVNPVSGAPVDGDNTGLTTGTVTGTNPDGTITGATTVNGAAYTNVQAPTGGITTLYTLDSASDTLYIQNPANGGTETMPKPIMLGATPLDFGAVNGFDIAEGVNTTAANAPVTAGSGLAALTVGGVTSLYSIDLTTGAATNVGAIGTGTTPVTGFTLAPAGTIQFQSAAVAVAENVAGGSATVTLTRTGGTSGAIAVTVTVTGGTATAGTDFTGGPYTVNFADGQTTATLSIPIAADTLVEPNETITLAITAAPGAVVAGRTATTLTILDAQRINIVLGTGSGGPTVAAFSAAGTQRFLLTPYGPSAPGGAQVARGDITGDGIVDIVTVNTVGAPIVRAFDGVTGASLGSFPVPGATAGASLAVGDINGDGKADIVVGSGFGGGVVAAFSGKDLSSLGSFLPFGAGFAGGVSVAAGDINGDGKADVIAGQARLGSLVAGFSGKDLSSLGSFPAGGGTGGVTLALADLNADGKLDIITGAATGTAIVRAYSGKDLSSLGSFPVFGGRPVGVNVSGNDLNGDGRPDLLLGTASGVGIIEGYSGIDLAFLGSLIPFGTLPGGVYVG